MMLLPGAAHIQAQHKFIIRGNISGLNNEMKVKLVYAIPHATYVDSTVTRQGKFELTGTISTPTKATLSLQSMDFQVFYICAGETTITGRDLQTAEIKGGQGQVDWLLLKSLLKPVDDSMAYYSKKIMEYNNANNREAAKALYPKMSSTRMEGEKWKKNSLNQTVTPMFLWIC